MQKIKDIFNKLKESAKTKTKLFSLFCCLSVLIIILIIALAAGWGVKSNSKTEAANLKVEEMIIKHDEITEINTLMNEYYTARVATDAEKLATLVDNAENLTGVQVQQFVESYNNISCYTMDGLEKNTYVVFVYWEVKLVNTETLAPGIDTFIVVKNEETGSYLIHTGLNDEEKAYINTVAENNDIKTLFENTNAKFVEAVNADTNLNKVYNYISEYSTQETTSAEGESTSAQETTAVQETTAAQ